MVPFALTHAADVHAAIAAAAGAEFIAGGTDMMQLLKDDVRRPARLVDISRLPLAEIEVGPQGARIGALAKMNAVGQHPDIRERFPVVSQSLLAAASPQVRNMGTIGGTLLQRTRCPYFRDVGTPCNKREPGSGCSAMEGENRINAILGTSEHCIAAFPGDLAVALLALDATVVAQGPASERRIPIGEFHRPPGDTPDIETELAPGELIVAIEIPATPAARRSHYLKVRDRASFEFALASAAVGLEIEGGIVREARVAVGGVATKPWRLYAVERALAGQEAGPQLYRTAAALAVEGARPREHNAYKVELLKRTVARALELVGEQG